ncbi:DUF2188 domain-containing protein [Luteibacter aegosomatissinici]|jgi:hypothetical protein|uniref:DUF2188 domain-containing protein n=1 Tax=Luteibacter aegosomatissinici TaxID=2911539 RepID=UPI001FFB61F9|nr:DUF2188 domain-containing protein [Luteibacter aegosomatissinici]UPG94052.1 DUF2188 domain-containing protein [Luteibacter aegosomatissinici]
MASSSAQLFIPYSESTQGPWIVRRASVPLGTYPTQADAIHAAEALSPGLSDSLGRPVAIHVQHADGSWEEHTWVVAGLVASAPLSPAVHAR